MAENTEVNEVSTEETTANTTDLESKIAEISAELDALKGENTRLKSSVSKANGEAAEWKRKHNALLSEDEKNKQTEAEEKEKLLAEVEELRRTQKVAVYQSKYLADGYDEDLAKSTAEALADGDLDKVFENQKKFIVDHDKKLKAGLMGKTPKPEAGESGGKTMTREKLAKLPIDERTKFYREHPDEYKELIK